MEGEGEETGGAGLHAYSSSTSIKRVRGGREGVGKGGEGRGVKFFACISFFSMHREGMGKRQAGEEGKISPRFQIEATAGRQSRDG